jgi:hypothetical protein
MGDCFQVRTYSICDICTSNTTYREEKNSITAETISFEILSGAAENSPFSHSACPRVSATDNELTNIMCHKHKIQ